MRYPSLKILILVNLAVGHMYGKILLLLVLLIMQAENPTRNLSKLQKIPNGLNVIHSQKKKLNSIPIGPVWGLCRYPRGYLL